MTEAIVELRDVFCVHRTNEGDAAALAGTNLELGRGEVLCVLGPSGAGKSTLLRVVAGLQPPSAGVVRVAGRDIGRLSARSRSRVRHELMGFLGQHTETALGPDLRMRDAVALPLALRGVPRPERRRRVDELFQITGLADRADARPGELSGGERQRFALCAALAHRPALLLADEPTGELDEASSDAVPRADRRARPDQRHQRHPGDPRSGDCGGRRPHAADPGRADRQRPAGRRGTERGGARRRRRLAAASPRSAHSAGIGRRARAQPSPDGVIVTRAAADSGPPAANASPPAANAAPPPGRWAPARVELCSVTRSYTRPPGAQRADARVRARPADRRHGPLGSGEDDAAEAHGRARPPEFGPRRARRAPSGRRHR